MLLEPFQDDYSYIMHREINSDRQSVPGMLQLMLQLYHWWITDTGLLYIVISCTDGGDREGGGRGGGGGGGEGGWIKSVAYFNQVINSKSVPP